jgi:hypothetical protein
MPAGFRAVKWMTTQMEKPFRQLRRNASTIDPAPAP